MAGPQVAAARAAALAELRAQIAQESQPAAPPPPEEPSFLDRMGGIRGLLAGGVRAGSGLLSGTGGVPGALISGGGELLAEGVEGSLFNPEESLATKAARIGTEAALGAVPAAKLIKEGRVAASALRGGLFSGVGEAGREFARGDDLDPGAIATSSVIGGTLTGGLSKLLGGTKAAPAVAPAVETATGRLVRPGGEIVAEKALPVSPLPAPTTRPTPADLTKTMNPVAGRAINGAMAGVNKEDKIIERLLARQGKQADAVDKIGSDTIDLNLETRARSAKLLAAEKETAQKAADEQANLDEIRGRMEGKEPTDPSVTESISATGPNGEKLSSSRRWVSPPEEEGASVAQADLTPPTPDPGNFGVGAPSSFKDSSPEVNTLESMFKAPGAPEATPPAPAGPKKNLLESLADSGQLYDPAIGMADLPKNAAFPVQPELPKNLKEGLAKAGLPEEALTQINADMADPKKAEETMSAVRQLLGLEEKPAAPKGPRGKKGAKAVAPVDVPTPPPAAQVTDVGEPTLVKKTGIGVPATLTPGQINRNIAQSMFEPEANTRLDELAKLLKVTKDKAARGPIAKEMLSIKAEQEAKLVHGPERPPAEDWLAKEGQAVNEAYDAAKAGGAEVGDVTEIPPSGGVTLGSGLGGLQDLLGVAAKHPGLTTNLASGAAGAAIGAATDPLDDPTESALAGGAAGFALPSLIRKMVPKIPPGSLPPAAAETVSHAADPNSITKISKDILQSIPSLIRGNLLAGPNLPANAIVAPWGSGVTGALEAHLMGDPRGTKLLELMHPMEWARTYKATLPEGQRLIESAAEGNMERSGSFLNTSKYPMKALSLPGVWMTTGDATTRKLGLLAGFTEDEMRAMTATNEPESALGRNLANIPRTGVGGQILMPFARTLVNLTEQGLKRTPGVGFLYDAMVEGAPKVTTKQQLLRQMLGMGVAGGAGAVGYNEDIDNPTGDKMLRSAVTNAAGPYQLLAAMGYAGGEALKGGDTPLRALQKAGTQGLQQIPLPSTDIPESYWKFFTTPPGEARRLPAGFLPAIFQKPANDLMAGGRKPLRPMKGSKHAKALKERK